ncbi:hypothetical protein [Sorangium sp. So ce590]
MTPRLAPPVAPRTCRTARRALPRAAVRRRRPAAAGCSAADPAPEYRPR